jgi:hypothetical protein
MNIDEKLDLLKKLNKVEAPPFMLTRVMQRVKSPSVALAPSAWRVAFFTIAIAILSLNVSIFLTASSTETNDGIGEVISSMELSTTNELYHD